MISRVLLFTLALLCCPAWAGEDLIDEANRLYQAGDHEQAHRLYLEAAESGSAEGHFNAAYKYILPHDDAVYHYVQAAELGHREALRYALDMLFFRAETMTEAKPDEALALFQRVKRAYPQTTLSQERDAVETMTRCVEAGPLDKSEFDRVYALVKEKISLEFDHRYGVLLMVEVLMNTDLAGTDNTHLALQLACRSGHVPAELEFAVSAIYQSWQSGQRHPFDLCDIVTSRYGMGFCAYRSQSAAYEFLATHGIEVVSESVWQINGHDVMPTCLETEWVSSDNYEAYQEAFPDASGFTRYPGQYWVTMIPLDPIPASWGQDVSIPKPYPACNALPDGYEIIKENNFINIEDPNRVIRHPEDPDSYRLLKRWGPETCEKLLPAFKGQCHSMVYVDRNEDTYYGQQYNSYAHVSYQGQDYIVPVTNAMSIPEALEFLDR